MGSRPVSIIFGATGGIGSATARILNQRGHQLVLVARNREKLERLAAELRETAASATQTAAIHTGDILYSASVDEVFDKTLNQYKGIDHVAHCVGSIVLKPITSVTDALFQETLQLNTASAFYVLRAACKHLPRTRVSAGNETTNKSVVLCTSAVSMHGLPNHEAIAAAKAALIGMAQSAAASYAPRGLRINCVAPGMTDTPLASFITSRPTALKASEALHPLGRIGRAEHVASAIALLLENPFITGHVLAVDGGLSTLVSQQSAR
jgi:NAD(P)-dependent dehydrogenase (short-subunit alcohol dehydrogenase family)